MPRTYSSRYADAEAVSIRQCELVARWGTAVEPSARVLEIGCADGFVTQALARRGYDVTAIDSSSEMIADAESRLRQENLAADLRIADVNQYELDESFDVVMALMWNFFHYVHEPLPVLARLAAHARVKVLIDANPRVTRIPDAVELMRSVGLHDVRWRPFFIPQRFRLDPVSRTLLRAAERTPAVRDLLLRKKFNVILVGHR
jgi:trans-aconitate methyltransferase